MNLLKQKITAYFTLLALMFGLFNFPANKPNLDVSADHSDFHYSASVVVESVSGTPAVQVLGATDILVCETASFPSVSSLDSSLGLNVGSAGLLASPASCFTIVSGQVFTQHSLQMAQLSSLPQIVVQHQTPVAYESRLNPYLPSAQPAALAVAFAISVAVIVKRKKLFEKRTRGMHVIRELEAASLPQLGVMRC